MNARISRALATVVVMASLPALLAAQSADSAAFIVRLGADTTGVERFVRTANRIDATSVTRSPRTTVRRLTIWLADDGSVARFATGGVTGELEERPSPDGAIPIVGGFYVPWEQALRRAQQSGSATTTVTVLAGGPMPIEMRRGTGGSWQFADQFDQAASAVIDDEGRMQRYAIDDGRISAERVAWLDIDAITTAFQARDSRGAGMGPLSPLDSVRASAGGANLVVEYSRPSLRGRSIDMLVPPGEVWRMGANNATTVETDRALQFDGLLLEPGRYSMFLDRGADGTATLIFNSQTGMSGLARDPARDVGRVTLELTEIGQPVEQFTITIEPAGAGGAIHIRWGTGQGTARFTAR
jgi:hypothetical protein